jgi:hypothetical protein
MHAHCAAGPKPAAEEVISALGMTPQSWGLAQQQLASLGKFAEEVQAFEKANDEAKTEVMKVKVQFKGLNELLDNHSDRIAHLENTSDQVLAVRVG